MKKIVIIIPCPYPLGHKRHLDGPSEDLDNYKEFYMSEVGGGYLDSEIKVFEDFHPYQLPDILKLCTNADIATIIFTGHGGMSEGNTYLQLNPDERIWLRDLKTTAKREIIILDSCRVSPLRHFNDTGTGIYGIGFGFDTTHIETARELYDHYLRLSGYGRIALYSSSPGQSSLDSEQGGRFSLSLLQEVLSWNQENDSIVLSVYDAFSRAKNDLIRTIPNQVPEKRTSTDAALDFPFALNPRLYLQKQNKQRYQVSEQQKESSGGGWLAALLILLGIGLIAASSSGDDTKRS